MKTVPLFGTGFPARSRTFSAQSRTNMYLVPGSDKSQLGLACTPGLTLFADVATAPSRGSISVNGNIYTVHDDGLFRVNPQGGVARIGTIDTATGPVRFAWSGTQLVMVEGSRGWIHTPASGAFVEIADGDFPSNPQTVAFIAGRFVVNDAGTGRFYWSGLLDAATWGALDFATAESETDNLVAVASDHGALVLLGTLTTEFWAPTGDSATFGRVGGSGAEWGCAAIRTVVKGDGGLCFLAKNQLGECRMVRLQGYNVVPFDDADVSHEINAQSDIADATAFSYIVDGRTFVQLNVGAVSLLYDGIGWSKVSSGFEGARHIANERAAMSERPYVFSYADGKLYLLDKESLLDGTDPIAREVVSKHLLADYNPVTLWELYLDCETGTNDANVMLQYSKDGGATWSSELWASMGAVGDYTRRVIWRRLGRARDIVLRFRVTDSVRWTIANAAVVVE